MLRTCLPVLARRSLALGLSAFLSLAPAGSAAGGGTNSAPASIAAAVAPRHAPDRVIVGTQRGPIGIAGVQGLGSLVEAASPLSPLAGETFVLELAPGRTVARALKRLRGLPGIDYAEPDYWVEAAAVADDPAFADGSLWGMYGDGTRPHGNRFGSGAAEAWQAGYVGARRIHVGVLDEGVKRDHPDLAGNTWANPAEVRNGLDDDGNGYVDDIDGWDFHHGDATVYDGHSDDHGTHVAGTLGALGGNGLGVAGVSWQVTLVPAKFLGPAGGYISNAVRALDYLTDLKIRHGIELVAVNSSWTGGGYSQSLVDAIDRAGDADILFVAAAGNEGADADAEPVYPGAYQCTSRADDTARGWDCIISVASLRPDGGLASDSNWGLDAVDLAAPGTGIISTHPVDDGYAYYSGTSMAAPHVTGAAALCRSVAPELPAQRLRELVLASAAPTASLAGRTSSGGRLDIPALMERCAAGPAPAPVLVDDGDGAFKRGGGGWVMVGTGHAGTHHRLPARDDARLAFGAWRPILPVAGRYRILAYIPDGSGLSRAATYKIRTADGWATRVRNQDKRRGTWVGLGIHELTTTPSVRLADLTGEPASWGRWLAYDAVRFVPLASDG